MATIKSLQKNSAVWSNWEKYVTTVLNTATGIETFVDASGRVISPHRNVPHVTAAALFNTILLLMSAIGVAYLSFCYNKYIGSSSVEQIVWPVISFWFAPFYQIYYSLVLNPLCNLKR
jgi:hypothetical protein